MATRQEVENKYNTERAAAQKTIDDAQAAYDNYIKSISDYGYAKQERVSPNSSKSKRDTYYKTVYYGGLDPTSSNATHVRINGKWKYNETQKYLQALNDAKDAFNKVKLGTWDESASYTDPMRGGNVGPTTNLSATGALADQALRAQQESNQQVSAANTAANINAGIARTAAGLLGSANAANKNDTANAVYGANQNNKIATQNDYLSRMAQAKALENQASNLESGAGAATAAAFFQGAGTGAGAGASLALTSDESVKEAPDEDNLLEMVKKFKSMYKQLQELRGGKK